MRIETYSAMIFNVILTTLVCVMSAYYFAYLAICIFEFFHKIKQNNYAKLCTTPINNYKAAYPL